MPTAILQTNTKQPSGNVRTTSVTRTITHNNARLYHHSDGHTYEYIGVDGSGNRIYRNTKKVRA